MTNADSVARLALFVAGVALADGINPSTVGPALVLALRPRGVALVLAFAAGVFLVTFAAGAVVVLGPGRVLVGHVPHIGSHTEHVAALCAGLVLLAVAVVAWVRRRDTARLVGGASAAKPVSALGFGAGIAAVELPTAVPYFAALAAIAASGIALVEQLALVVSYGIIFVAPIVAIAVVRAAGASRLASVQALVARYGAAVLAAALAVAGSALLVVGVAGTVGA